MMKGRSSLLELQNHALIKTARERAAQIEKLEAEVQNLQERAAQADRLERELQRLQEQEAKDDKLECDPQDRQQWAARAEKLEIELESLRCELRRIQETQAQSQKLVHELQTRLAAAERQTEEIERLTLERDFYSKRVLALEDHNRQLTEAATQYSLWGQKLERELARIDPDGAPARRFDAQDDA